MTEHRAPGRTRLTSRQVRALLALLAVALLTTGLGVRGTFAAWSDSATVVSGPIESGSLDLSVDGSLIGQANNGGSVNKPAYGAGNIVPGESFAFAYPVKNEGSVPFTYTTSTTAAGDFLVAGGLRVTFYAGTSGLGAANNTMSSSGFRTASCTSGSAGTTATSNAATTVAPSRALAPGATEFFCALVQLPANATNALQGRTATVSVKVVADQLTS